MSSSKSTSKKIDGLIVFILLIVAFAVFLYFNNAAYQSTVSALKDVVPAALLVA